jgi:transcriptional activator-regulatory protein (phage-related repressor protein)
VSEPQNPNTVRVDILDVEASAGNGAYLSPTEQGLLSQELDLMFFYK